MRRFYYRNTIKKNQEAKTLKKIAELYKLKQEPDEVEQRRVEAMVENGPHQFGVIGVGGSEGAFLVPVKPTVSGAQQDPDLLTGTALSMSSISLKLKSSSVHPDEEEKRDSLSLSQIPEEEDVEEVSEVDP